MIKGRKISKPFPLLAILFFMGIAVGYFFHTDIREAKEDFMRGFSGAREKTSVEITE
ncbi:hypothetical protein [Persicobacter diffluens]|uniref:Uncharacterized protein n=1 Tax=Persicobacter diffluens TaxID=981 RepID=A0AAN4W132_9BACT|nr:hypothetical protein PEDI_29240 [Persicobacter diffluens]